MSRPSRKPTAPRQSERLPPRRTPRWAWPAGAALLLTAAVAGIILFLRPGATPVPHSTPAAAPAPAFVGSARCASCHQEESRAWQGSHHQQAMQHASPETVLGDFSGTTFTADGETTTFLRRDSLFLVRSRGADGAVGEFAVRYTFGVDPLQQYLVELEGGRIQPLTVAWDARPAGEGGQRWMTLYPGQRIEHGDELHWSGRQQNWNFMCADCHSTDVRKNYDRERGSFSTAWAEITVGCEACHGPASNHLRWADRYAAGDDDAAPADRGLTVALDERRGVSWSLDPVTGLPRRSTPRASEREIAVCAQCHSRRAQIAEGYVAGAPLLDHYQPSLLMPGLYHADGRQRDEVYTHASFLQSRMFAAGVTCSDCHDPHTQKLRAEGNGVCAQCHTAARYDTATHHLHPSGSAGAQCVSCHMPEETYMRIDRRRDHSIRVPRPDLSLTLGTPEPCTGCHTDRSASWAATALRAHLGRDPAGFQTFASAFTAHENGDAGAADSLARLARQPTQPAIVRASALARLADTPGLVALEAARAGLVDPDPLARRAALEIIEMLPPAERIPLAAPLLNDPLRTVRLQAAWVLAPAGASLAGNPQLNVAFTRAANEFIASQRYLSDRPENRVTLGTFLVQLGRGPEAEVEYRAALRMRPREVAAYVNLADLLRARGQEAEAERLLREGLALLPEEPALHHALGLSLARSGQLAQARESLQRAATFGQEQPRYLYAYAVAQHSGGDVAAAIATLEDGLVRHPRDYDLLFALATFHRDAGRRGEALRYATRLREAHPYDAGAVQLEASLR